jgi:hypothetical protein
LRGEDFLRSCDKYASVINDRHPEVRAVFGDLEGCAPGTGVAAILRGAQERAPPE